MRPYRPVLRKVNPAELVKVRDVYGTPFYVLRIDVESQDRTLLPIYQSTGLSLAAWMEQMNRPALSTRLHRDNIAEVIG